MVSNDPLFSPGTYYFLLIDEGNMMSYLADL